jgi:four helix bundle protein
MRSRNGFDVPSQRLTTLGPTAGHASSPRLSPTHLCQVAVGRRQAREDRVEDPFAQRDLARQLRRASTSVSLNIAEGADEFSAAEKARFYRIARRSAAECLAILDLLDLLQAPGPDLGDARADLLRVRASLVNLVRSVDRRKR